MKKKITVIGGGTGQANLLRGLKNYNIDLTAVVTMADDGGGSGKLRQEIGMLPPGDIRNCIIALSDIEPAMETLMQHRFKEGSLKGQSFGNLFLAALNEIYGDYGILPILFPEFHSGLFTLNIFDVSLVIVFSLTTRRVEY